MPKLKRGQKAPGIEKIEKRNKRSVKSISDEINKAIREPDNADEKIVIACKNQGNLAKLEILEKGIVPMSLNTLKRHANVILDGGWEYLEDLRITAYSLYQERKKRKKRAGRGGMDGLKLQIQTLKEENQQLINSAAEFADQYLDLIKTAWSLVKKDKTLENKLTQHLNKYPKSKMGLRIIDGGKHD